MRVVGCQLLVVGAPAPKRSGDGADKNITELPLMTKAEVARNILDRIERLL